MNFFNQAKQAFKLASNMILSSQRLIIISTLYFAFILNIAFWSFINSHIHITDVSLAVFTVSLLFFIMVPLYWLFNLIITPYTGKFLLIVLLIISSITNYMMYQFGIYIDSDMIRNTVETNQREAFDLITFNNIMWVSITGFFPALIVSRLSIKYQPFLKELKHRFIYSLCGLLILGLFTATSFKEYASFGRNNRELKKIINTTNYLYSTVRYLQAQSLKNRPLKLLDKTPTLLPSKDPHPQLLVLVVGETARAKNFSLLGYAKETNPLLKKENIISFSNVSSCGTATAISVPCMFSNATRHNFDVVDAKYTENLLDILKKSGYNVLWRDNDDGCKGVCDRVNTEYMVKTNVKPHCKSDYCYDESLLVGLPEILANLKTNTVIVLHMMGSHGPTYYNRYTDSFKHFQPTCDTADIHGCTQEQLVNTYDNTIVYTDYVLASLINQLKPYTQYKTGLIYVSDHGESLGEHGIYLHGLPYNIAPKEQTHIPMIVWMNDTLKQLDGIDEVCLKQAAQHNQYSHDNFFHSVIGLSKVKTTVYEPEKNLFNPCIKAH